MDSPQNDTDYLEHWSLLRDTLDLILTNRPGTYDPVSYEQTYSAVYKCVCKSYSERLYKDIMTHVRQILDRWTRDIMLVGDLELPARFNEIHTQYFHAINSLLPIFTYLNRFYVESKLSTNLSVEFERLFVNSLCDDTVDRLVGKKEIDS